jgi:hypothetical protein
MIIKRRLLIVLSKDQIDSAWSKEEFWGIDFNDKRLTNRFIKLSEAFLNRPSVPINQACEDWSDTKAAYRLFDNQKVTPQEILRVHQTRTQERMRDYPLVLAVQDTTYLDYTHHPKKKGLGPIGSSKQNTEGLFMHSTLAVNVQGLPLGVLSQEIWARDEQLRGKKKERKRRPIEQKESYKWLKALIETVQWIPDGVKVVSVCDREADIYEFITKAQQLRVQFLVRAAQDRALCEHNKRTIEEFMASEPKAGDLRIEVPAKGNQPARVATAEVRFASVKLRPPKRFQSVDKKWLRPIHINVVWVREVNVPDNIEPLKWTLLTNVAVNNFGDALERIRWYEKRWHIEVYHKVLKSGCKVEDCRLERAERLIRYLTLFSIIAWRIYWMSQINRQYPQRPCSLVLEEHEWKALYCTVHHTTELPKQIPTVQQVVRWIAQLGGFLGRKRDKEPGVTVIWRGWQRLNDIADTWLLLHPEQTYG